MIIPYHERLQDLKPWISFGVGERNGDRPRPYEAGLTEAGLAPRGTASLRRRRVTRLSLLAVVLYNGGCRT